MKEDDHATNVSTPSNNMLEGITFQNQNQVSEKTKAEAYQVKRLRKQARNNPIRGGRQ